MKKFLCLFLCLLMLCGFTACAVEDTPTKETNSNQEQKATESTEPTDDIFKLNETAVFKSLKVTATEMKSSNGDEFFKPADGKTFVGVKFTIENTSDEAQSISSLLSFTAYADDVKCDYSFNAACAFDEGTLDGDIAAGKKLIGWYAVEIPRDWKSLEIDFQPDLLSNITAKFVLTK